jgi:FG-GAP-like repeat
MLSRRLHTSGFLATIAMAGLLAMTPVAQAAETVGITGDGKADVVAQSPVDGEWGVAASTAVSFASPTRWLYPWAGATHYKLLTGDFNGDDNPDALAQNPMDGEWGVALSTGNAFAGPSRWLLPWAASSHYRLLAADFNGDRKDDVLAQNPVDGEWAVALSTGSSFAAPTRWLLPWAASSHYKIFADDFTGDGKADIMVQNPQDGEWTVARSNGSAFVSPSRWLLPWAVGDHYKIFADDFTGDGKADVLVQNPQDGEWAVAASNGSAFVSPTRWLMPWAASAHYKIMTGDLQGDGKSDIIVQNPLDGEWAAAYSWGNTFSSPSRWLMPWAASTHYRLLALSPRRYTTSSQYGGSTMAVDTQQEVSTVAQAMNQQPTTSVVNPLYYGMSPNERVYFFQNVDGQLFREVGSTGVYYLIDNARYWVSSPEVAEAAGLDLSTTKIVPNGSFTYHLPRGADMTLSSLNVGGPEPDEGTATAAGTSWKYHGQDNFTFYSGDGRAKGSGTVKWYHGKFPYGFRHRGDFTSSSFVSAYGTVPCIWTKVKWGYPAASVSLPPGGAISGAEEISEHFVKCRSDGWAAPDALSLYGLGFAKGMLNSVTVTACSSNSRAEGPRFCSNHKMTY